MIKNAMKFMIWLEFSCGSTRSRRQSALLFRRLQQRQKTHRLNSIPILSTFSQHFTIFLNYHKKKKMSRVPALMVLLSLLFLSHCYFSQYTCYIISCILSLLFKKKKKICFRGGVRGHQEYHAARMPQVMPMMDPVPR